MWRSAFVGLGFYACLLGAESLVVERAVLRPEPQRAGQFSSRPREVVPPDWAPWSLLSGGSIAMLYAFTLRKE